jgi:hypothetical protein
MTTLLPPLPKIEGSLLEEIYIAAEDVVFPASQYEDPARLAFLGKYVYAVSLIHVLLRYMTPQRLEGPAISVSVLY